MEQTNVSELFQQFKELAHRYGFYAKLRKNNIFVLQAKDLDDHWIDWIKFNLSEKSGCITGNTDNCNLWFCDIRKDLTPERIISFVKELNVVTIKHFDVFTKLQQLIDPEDWQELADVHDAYEDIRYTGESEKIHMQAHFRIRKYAENGTFRHVPLSELTACSVGGFSFTIDGKEIEFDWDAFAVSDVSNNGECIFESGYGPFFNDHRISNACEEGLARSGMRRCDLTAAFLAKATAIEEFHISLDDAEREDISFGLRNENPLEFSYGYAVELINICFTDCETEETYGVDHKAIDAYNKSIAV